jgi:tetratricopeptide (TPR) repeat protein
MDPELASIKKQAEELKLSGKYSDALRLRLALEQLYEQRGFSAVEQSLNLNWIAFLSVHSDNLDEAERAARKCIAVYRPVSANQDETLATYLMMLSLVLAEKRDFDEAIVYGEQAVAIFANIHSDASNFVKARKADITRMRNKTLQPYLDR